MPMGRGFNVWELFELWKQVRRLWPVYRQVLRGKSAVNGAKDGGQSDRALGNSGTRRGPDGK